MSRLGKVILGGGLFLVLSGLLLAFAGRVMGADTSLELNYRGQRITVTPHGIVNMYREPGDHGEEQTLYVDDLAAFDRLEIDLDLGEVIVQEGDALSLDLTWHGAGYELHYSDENGLLKVWSTDMELLGGHRDYGGSAVLTLPYGTTLAKTDIHAALGSVDLSGFSAKDLTLTADLGDVYLSGMTSERADLRLDLGSLSVGDLTVTDTLDVKNSLGSVDIAGSLNCDIDIDADLGGVVLYTGFPVSDYHYSLQADLGSVEIDGEEQKDGHASGGRGAHKLDVSADLGSVEVYFG